MTSIERVFLIRHGQTDWNLDGRWQGVLPVGLNNEGHLQARELANYLSARPIKTIVSSDIPRAFDTAKAIGDVLSVTVQTDERLREFNLGIFQGLTRDQIAERYPQEWQGFRADYWNYVVQQGESRRDLQNRAYAAWHSILQEAIGPEVAIVSHGGTIRMLLFRLFEDVPGLNEIHIDNTSLTTIERQGDSWHLAEIAAVPHLLTR